MTQEQLITLPKIELHCHLDGSLSREFIEKRLGRKVLQEELAARKIGIEMCPISNLQTKAVQSTAEYPLREFLDAGLRVTINTDNRTVSNTTLTKELEFVQKQYGIRDEEVLLLMKNAVDAAFAVEAVKERLYRSITAKYKR